MIPLLFALVSMSWRLDTSVLLMPVTSPFELNVGVARPSQCSQIRAELTPAACMAANALLNQLEL